MKAGVVSIAKCLRLHSQGLEEFGLYIYIVLKDKET